MINFIKSDIQHYVVAIVGALIFSTACVGAAVGPVALGQSAGVAGAMQVPSA